MEKISGIRPFHLEVFSSGQAAEKKMEGTGTRVRTRQAPRAPATEQEKSPVLITVTLAGGGEKRDPKVAARGPPKCLRPRGGVNFGETSGGP